MMDPKKTLEESVKRQQLVRQTMHDLHVKREADLAKRRAELVAENERRLQET